jgi:hypothetical protein
MEKFGVVFIFIQCFSSKILTRVRISVCSNQKKIELGSFRFSIYSFCFPEKSNNQSMFEENEKWQMYIKYPILHNLYYTIDLSI